MEQARCENCLCWNRNSALIKNAVDQPQNPDQGICKFFPPTVQVAGMSANGPVVVTMRPTTHKDDGCMQFQKREAWSDLIGD